MKTSKIFGLLFALFLVQSCSKKSASDFDSDYSLYKDYITSFSSGYVSVHSDFRVQLAFNKSDWKPNQELDDDLFTISPSVSGKVVALSNNTIAFIPKDKLEQNTLYQITLHLSEITNKVPKELSDFNFSVKTIKQDFLVNLLDLQSYSKDWYYLNGTLTTADDLSFEDAQKIITSTQQEKKLKITFDKALSTPTNFKFTIDSIQRFVGDTEIAIDWDGDDVDIDQKGSVTFPIPGKNQFKVLSIKVGDVNNQSVLINFSDPLKQDQDFKGLVAIENTNNLKFSTMGNVLKVFYNQESDKSKVDKGSSPRTVDVAAVDSTAVVDTTAAAVDTEEAVEAVNGPNEHSFSGSKLVEIFQGIESIDGYKMKSNYSERLLFVEIKPGVKLLQSGTILPSSNNLKINFEAANLKAIDVKVFKIYKNNIMQFLQDNELNGTENLRQVSQAIAKSTIELKQNNLLDYTKWNTYALDLSKLIKPEPGAIYRVEFSYKKAYSMYRCDGSTSTSSEDEDEEDYRPREQEDVDEDDVNRDNHFK